MNRCTVLIVTDGLELDAAISKSIGLMDELNDKLPFAHDPSKNELYAVGDGASLKDRIGLPHGKPGAGPAATYVGDLHYIWSDGRWYTPADCPPAPADHNDATGWQWLYYNVMHNSGPTTYCFLWDIYPLPLSEAA